MALLTRDYWDRKRSVPCTDGLAAEKIAQLREAATLLNEMGFHDAARVLRLESYRRARALRRLTIYRQGGDPWSSHSRRPSSSSASSSSA